MGRSLIFFAWPTRKPQTSSHSWDRCSSGLVMPHWQSASCLTSIVTQHFSWGSGVSQAVTLLSWSLWIRDEVLRKKSRNSPWTSCNIYLSFLEITFFLFHFENLKMVCGKAMKSFLCQVWLSPGGRGTGWCWQTSPCSASPSCSASRSPRLRWRGQSSGQGRGRKNKWTCLVES